MEADDLLSSIFFDVTEDQGAGGLCRINHRLVAWENRADP